MAKRIDDNQQEIVIALRRIGASVLSLAPVGKGCPDLLVGLAGQNHLLEVKDGNKIPSKQKLTPDQIEFHSTWRGTIHVVRTVDEALEAVTRC